MTLALRTLLVCSLVAVGMSSHASAALVAHYSFDNSGNLGQDTSGNGYNATVNGTPSFDPSAAAFGGGAIRFNNTDTAQTDYLSLPNMSSQFTNAASLSMWVKLDKNVPTNSNLTGIEGLGNSGLNNSHYSWTDGTGYFSTFRNTDRVDSVDVSTNLTSEGKNRTDLHNIVITSDPTGWKLYQDGLLTESTTQGGFHFNSAATIGKSFAGYFMAGAIDEVQIFNTALNINQIDNLITYNQTIPEPSTFVLGGLGMIGLLIAARRRRIQAALVCCLVVAGLSQSASADVISSPGNDIALQSNGGVGYEQAGLGVYDTDHGPDKLNDGNRDGVFGSTPFSIFHSSTSTGGYFGVTLNQLYDINSINLFTRTDGGNGTRIDGNGTVGFNVEILRNNAVVWNNSGTPYLFTSNINLTGTPNHDTAAGMTIAIPGIIGDDVRIVQNFSSYVNIAEVEAFGQAVPEPSSVILFGLAAIGLFVAARRRRKA